MAKQDDDMNFDNRIYKSYIEQEVEKPETQKAKDKLLKDYFGTKSPFNWPPIFIPIMGVSCVGAFVLGIYLLLSPKFNFPAPTPPTVPPVEEVLTKQAITPKIWPTQNVLVSQVSSKTGPTMVFQKPYDDALVTVVWVFPGGK